MEVSREHLYKAKRVDWRELPKEEWWVEGNLLISDDDYYIIPDFGVSCVEKLNNFVCDKLITLHAFEVDKETVCEYTGLQDKNGRKIFEGDIVKIGLEYYEVWWNCDSSSITLSSESESRGLYLSHNETIEVTSNIFDNPELLEGGDVE